MSFRDRTQLVFRSAQMNEQQVPIIIVALDRQSWRSRAATHIHRGTSRTCSQWWKTICEVVR